SRRRRSQASAYSNGCRTVPPPTTTPVLGRVFPVLWSVARGTPGWRRSTRSTGPRRLRSPITGAGSGTLAGSACGRSRSASPKDSSKRHGTQPSSASAARRSHSRRSARMPSMPSLHTRSIAGQSFPAQRAATVSSTPSTAARAASRFAGRTGRSSAARSSLRTANWTSWKSAPRVSGSSTSIATGLELIEAGQPSGRRTQRLEPVERRHPRPCLLDVDARPREDDALAGRAHGEPECESLRADPGGLRGERGDVESAAVPVEEDRILDDLPREELLGEAGDEDDVEGEATRRLGGRNEDGAVAPPRRRHGQFAEPRAEDELHLVEIDRADRAHRLDLGERCEHAVRPAERRGGERAQVCEP